jgi:hypothetical protein
MSAATNSIPRPFVIAALPELGILLNFWFRGVSRIASLHRRYERGYGKIGNLIGKARDRL